MDFTTLATIAKTKTKKEKAKESKHFLQLVFTRKYYLSLKKRREKEKLKAPILDPPQYGIFHL